MSTSGSMRVLDGERGVVRVEDVYDTGIEDLWRACTEPDRLARWIARVSGDPRVGNTVELCFTSTWTGPARIEVCEAPHHLLLIQQPGTDEETALEAWLSTEGTGTRLVIEERGVPRAALHFYGAGWQAHLEDLGRCLAVDGSVHREGWSPGVPSPEWKERWEALIPVYADRQVS